MQRHIGLKVQQLLWCVATASGWHTASGTRTVNISSSQLEAERRERHYRIEPGMLRGGQHTFSLLIARRRAAVAALALLALLLPSAPLLQCDAARPPPAAVGMLPSIFDRAVLSCIRTMCQMLSLAVQPSIPARRDLCSSHYLQLRRPPPLVSVPEIATAPVQMIPAADNAATPDGALTSEAIAAQVTQVQPKYMVPPIKKHVVPATDTHPGAERSLGAVSSAWILANAACDVVQQPRSRFGPPTAVFPSLIFPCTHAGAAQPAAQSAGKVSATSGRQRAHGWRRRCGACAGNRGAGAHRQSLRRRDAVCGAAQPKRQRHPAAECVFDSG